jgi:hypothetical protein
VFRPYKFLSLGKMKDKWVSTMSRPPRSGVLYTIVACGKRCIGSSLKNYVLHNEDIYKYVQSRVKMSQAQEKPVRFVQAPIQCVPGALSLGVRRPGREADYSPPSSAEVKE